MDNLNQKTGAETHTDEQKQHFYDQLTEDQRKKQSFSEWVKEAYNEQYEKWMPWLEEQYLKWFGKGDNKASYVTKGKNMCLSQSSWIIMSLERLVLIHELD